MSRGRHISTILMNVNIVYLQKVNAPAIIPFAIAAGNRACPSRVKGVDKKMKSGGGITRRRLFMGSSAWKHAVILSTYRSIGK